MARLLKVSTRTATEMMGCGELPYLKIRGKLVRFRAADVETAPATAPAAELELGRLLLAVGRRDEAVATLEHLILTYSSSALVPQARRLLDEARGAVPRT